MELYTPQGRRTHSEAVWRLIVQTYKDYGNSEDGNLYGADLENLIRTPGCWKLVAAGDEFIAGIIFRHCKGSKMRLVLHNCTHDGKEALRHLLITEFNSGRCWGECSGNLERVLRAHGAPIIANTRAAAILEKPILHLDPDGVHYEREVFPGTVKREMLFGTVR
ncbi:MAG TPA: hypothetical protein VN495_04475 [Candidatus Paceibacterota bacterium]|nr:hypothetical protein [Candidatus Paceibacterota bacterium]